MNTLCRHDRDPQRLFCPVCGRLRDRRALRSIAMLGAIGPRHSSSEAIDEFWHTGEPEVLRSKARHPSNYQRRSSTA